MSHDVVSLFREFASGKDLLSRSHSGLTQNLIPAWLQSKPETLTDLIEGSAYGETPPELAYTIFDLLELSPGDSFLDLGCGAANICLYALARTDFVYGIEHNPHLAAAGRELFESAGFDGKNVMEADFLVQAWPAAKKLFTTSSRFPDSTAARLATRVEQSPAQWLATLGKPLPLASTWRVVHSSQRELRWNPSEQNLREQLTVSRRDYLI